MQKLTGKEVEKTLEAMDDPDYLFCFKKHKRCIHNEYYDGCPEIKTAGKLAETQAALEAERELNARYKTALEYYKESHKCCSVAERVLAGEEYKPDWQPRKPEGSE